MRKLMKRSNLPKVTELVLRIRDGMRIEAAQMEMYNLNPFSSL